MTPDFRALCAELIELSAPVDSISQLTERLQKLNELADRARALLAQPEPEGPSDEELDELFTEIDQSGEALSWRLYARATLDRWGRAAAAPVAMIELITDMAMHLAHMQELLEDYEYGDPEDYHWYRESVRLRSLAAEVLA